MDNVEINTELERKVKFYERVYIPYMRNTFDEFFNEVAQSALICIGDRKNDRALELLANMSVLLKEPRIIDGGSYDEMN